MINLATPKSTSPPTIAVLLKVFPVGVNVVEDLAVDWIGGNLYWNDYVVETIEVAKLDGSMKTILFSENITNPRGIEVDPRSGYSTAFQ